MTHQEILDWINIERKCPPELAYRHLMRCPNWKGYEVYSPYEPESEVGEYGGSWPIRVIVKGKHIRVLQPDEDDDYLAYLDRYYPDWPD